MTRSLAPYLLIAVAAVAGCGTSQRSADDARAASASYEEAVEAFNAGDAQVAADKLTSVIEARLDPDQFGSAVVRRAVCYAKLGEFEKAHADLDRAAGGAPNVDEIHAARSYVLTKEGKQSEADKEWRKARQVNSTIAKFTD